MDSSKDDPETDPASSEVEGINAVTTSTDASTFDENSSTPAKRTKADSKDSNEDKEPTSSASTSERPEGSRKKRKVSKSSERAVHTEFYDIDERLEEIAQKSKLSATNVKSILKNVIRNEYVIEMVKNIISNQANEPEFEPKITRSKLKALAEESEKDVEHDLLIADAEEPELEEEEDEDDQEYNPVEDEEEDDEEEDDQTEREGSSALDIEPAGDLQESVVESQVPTSSEADSQDGTFEDLICLRTRSKCTIPTEPPDTLELPDVTDDLYGVSENVDEDWKQFLTSLFVDSPSRMVEDDEMNDPEYNVFEDIDDLVDSWDLRNDKAVKVSNKEYQDLLGEDAECETVDVKELTQTESSLSKWSSSFSTDDLRLVHQQMAQHVQLLCQMYLITGQSQTLSWVADSIKILFRDLRHFSTGKKLSFFRPINYEGALQTIEGTKLKISGKVRQSTSWRRCPLPADAVQTIALNPNVFHFPQLLPLCGCYDVEDVSKAKTNFTSAEDRLIALGLEQFKPLEKKCYKYIKQLLVPVKSEAQIRTHVKNLKRKSSSIGEENPIIYYLKHGSVPPLVFPPLVSIEKRERFPEDIMLPDWLTKQLNADPTVKSHGVPTKKCFLSPLKLQAKPWNASSSPYKQASSIVKKYKMYKVTRFPVIRQRPLAMKEPVEIKADITTTTVEEKDTKSEKPTSSEDSAINDGDDVNEDGNDEANNSEGNPVEPEAKLDDEDNVSDLEALMVASSTITSNKMRANQNMQNKREGKKLLAAKHRESTALLLSDNWIENDAKKADKEQILIQHFLSRVREVLTTNEDYVEFLTCLSEFGLKRTGHSNSSKTLKDLYSDIERLLAKVGADDVLDEFILFLGPKEAQECGKMFEYLYWRRFVTFVRKLEVCFSGDPSSLYRLYKGLCQLKQSESSIDKKKLRNTISKVVNNHPYLMHELSTLFLDERPSEHLFSQDEDFDEISLASDDEEDSGPKEYFENVTLSLTTEDTKFGTNECPCKRCHNDVDQENKKHHCLACSIKFMGGKVYLLQGQKKPQLAEVHYEELCSEEKTVAGAKQTSPSTTEDSAPESGSSRKPDEERPTSLKSPEEWTINDDRLLLKLCKSKVSEKKLESQVFDEVAKELNRSCEQIAQRFNYLLEVFKQSRSAAN